MTDIFLINETNLDESFSSKQFAISRSKFIRKDRKNFGGGITFYINDQWSSRIMKIENRADIKIQAIKILICKNSILVALIYKPPNLGKTDFTASLETLNKLSNTYEKLIVMRIFNMNMISPYRSQFLDTFALSPLYTDPTCFKSSKDPSYIDL